MQEIMNYKDLGKGDCIVILHGLFGTGDNWISIARKLSDSFRVILPDLRNHGESFHHESMNYDIMSDDLIHLINQLNLNNINLIGHSMGGKVAMAVANKMPELLKKLIVADIAPIDYEGHHYEIFEAMTSLDLSKMNRRSDIEEELAKTIKDFSIRQFILKNIKNEDKTYKWKLNIDNIYKNYQSLLNAPDLNDNIETETLFLKGDQSDYIQKSSEIFIKQFFPNSEIQIISNSGHWLHAANPQEFLEKSLKFINN